ncbi:hypothetical protein BCR35DRAFT_349850 [Leucosporidium creatinivorum]|uniref:F-box domain-containing protein n=1 Tax=Leucosporidium creatinivorum TaxID=106004 RepID=A0A1Y2G086_9BASI|nr:hypothetical protein BCR35DRAFT_349850 [Leucosporidium creatinivorum]
MSPPSLPIEILDEIFDGLPPSALASLCLVCRDFLPIARPRLYSMIRIATPEDYPPRDIPDDLDIPSQQRLSVLCAQPHLAALVRSTWVFLLGVKDAEHVQDVLKRLVQACPGLQSVDVEVNLDSAPARDLEDALAELKQLKTLKLCGLRWDSKTLAVLRAHPQLTSLALEGRHAPSSTELGEPPSFELQSLHLRGAFAGLAHHFIRHSHHTLHTLRLSSPVVDLDLSSFTALRTLTIDGLTESSAETAVKTASNVPFLDTLTFYPVGPDVALALERSDFLRRLPPSLRHLQRDLIFTPSYTLNALRDCSLLPNLKTWNLAQRQPARGGLRNEEIVEIKAAAQARGVELRDRRGRW